MRLKLLAILKEQADAQVGLELYEFAMEREYSLRSEAV